MAPPRLLVLLGLLSASAVAWPQAPELMPDPGFEQPDLRAWRGTPGWVALDDSRAASGKYSACLRVGPEYPLTHLDLLPAIAVQPWCWYELSYSYALEPPARLEWYLLETDDTGTGFNRTRREYGPRHPAPGQFVRAAFRFLTRPGVTQFRVYPNAYCASKLFLPGRVWVDDLSLRLLGPAESAASESLALYDPGFEADCLFGYAFHDLYQFLVSPTAKQGRQVLRKADRTDGKFCVPLLRPVENPLGHLFRGAIWARGTGSAFVNFPVQSSVFYDLDPASARKRFPLDPQEWRQVYLDMIVDRPELEVTGLNVWFWGDVEFDAATLTRLR